MRRSTIVLTALPLLCGGCMVGPEFERPAPPDGVSYGEQPDPVQLTAPNGGGTQVLVFGADLPQAWWTLFRSRRLDALVRQGLAANPGIAQAEAALRQARSFSEAARGELLPNLFGGLSRGGLVHQGSGLTGTYGGGVMAGYGVDLFGGVRRGIEAQEASETATAERLRAAALALSGNIVTTAIREANLSAQIAISETVLKRYREQRDLVKIRHEAGAEPVANILSQESLIRSQEGVLIGLRAARTTTRHQIAVLIGQEPSAYAARGFGLAELLLPRRIPVSLPASLVAQRPDIRGAEADLHAASAEIGVATADLLPQVGLSASLGANATTLAALAASSTWGAATAIAQPLFDGGVREARRQAALARYDAARSGYRSAVLAALQNVADALTTLEADAAALTAAVQAEDLARQALDASEVKFRAGQLPYASLLLAQTQYAAASLTRLNAQTQRLTDSAALIHALGGGW